MNLDNLDKNYYILYSFSHKGNEIFVCRDKKNLAYTYFKLQNEKFINVKSKSLDAFLKPFVDDVLFEDILLNQFSQQENAHFNNALILAKLSMLDIISEMPDKLREKMSDKLTSVNYNIKNIKDGAGSYCSNTHCITIDASYLSSPLLTHVLLHEMIHSVSANDNKCGFRCTNLECFSSGNIFKQNIHTILNEAYTEILAQRYEPVNQKYYDFPIKMFSTILKLCDDKKIMNFYFSSNVDGFINYLASNFHQTQTDIMKLSLLFDACYHSYEYSLKNNKSYIKSNVSASFSALYNMISKMVIDKYAAEAKDKLNSLKFSDIFSKKIGKKSNSYIDLRRNRAYFDYYKNKQLSSSKVSQFNLNMFPICQKKFIESFVNDVELSNFYPDDYKIFEIYQQVLAPSSIIYDKNGNVISKQNLFQRLFNEDKNYLPKNKNEKIKIVNQYLEIMDQYNFDITMYINKDLIIKCISNSKLLFDKMCINNVYFLLNNEKQLPSHIQCSKSFYNGLLNQLVKEENKNGPEIIRNYFYSMDIKSQQKIRNDVCFLTNLKESGLLTASDYVEFMKETAHYVKDNGMTL